MKVHSLWYVCLLVRVLLILCIRMSYIKYKISLSVILLLMGIGFIYKGYFSSNNEIQISNVFWHETRYLHGMLYIFSAYFLFKDKINMNTIVLILDLCLSVIYRIVMDK